MVDTDTDKKVLYIPALIVHAKFNRERRNKMNMRKHLELEYTSEHE